MKYVLLGFVIGFGSTLLIGIVSGLSFIEHAFWKGYKEGQRQGRIDAKGEQVDEIIEVLRAKDEVKK